MAHDQTTPEGREALRLEVLGSPEAVKAYDAALTAAHAFAQASGCGLGLDVTAWLHDRTHDLVMRTIAEQERHRVQEA